MTTVIQRPLRGSRISSFYPVKVLPSLSSLDSAFQLQEYISLLIRLEVHDVETIVTIPGKGSARNKEGNDDMKGDDRDGDKDGKNEVVVDEACWIYEQLRRLAQDLSHPLITMLQQECTRATCPEMKAGEWLYLCVAHGNDGAMEQCCAIDYILHTLDSATALLNSPRAFPSRLSIPQPSHRHFSSLARRLGRIFAHAYFHHREAFEQAEAESSLYARFLALTSKYDLVPADFLLIPPRLTTTDMHGEHDRDIDPPRLLSAAVDPQRNRGERENGKWLRLHDNNITMTNERNSPPGPAGPTRIDSPRKLGRNRTDTMVHSDVYGVAEELAETEDADTDLSWAVKRKRLAAAIVERNRVALESRDGPTTASTETHEWDVQEVPETALETSLAEVQPTVKEEQPPVEEEQLPIEEEQPPVLTSEAVPEHTHIEPAAVSNLDVQPYSQGPEPSVIEATTPYITDDTPAPAEPTINTPSTPLPDTPAKVPEPPETPAVLPSSPEPELHSDHSITEPQVQETEVDPSAELSTDVPPLGEFSEESVLPTSTFTLTDLPAKTDVDLSQELSTDEIQMETEQAVELQEPTGTEHVSTEHEVAEQLPVNVEEEKVDDVPKKDETDVPETETTVAIEDAEIESPSVPV